MYRYADTVQLSLCFTFTLQTDGLEVGDSAAGPQVEEVVVGVLRDGLTLVPVVVHVEAFAAGISLTPSKYSKLHFVHLSRRFTESLVQISFMN